MGGNINCTQSLCISTFSKLTSEIFRASGCTKCITTHSFRRGGAQWLFFDAPSRVGLTALRYWGGWVKNDKVGCHDIMMQKLF